MIALAALAACSSSGGAGGGKADRGTISSADRSIDIEDEALRGSAADFIANSGDRVFFAFDSSALTPDAKATLNKQARWLTGNSRHGILIEGHTDERGTREYNLGLGERRADAAARYLIQEGVAAGKVRTISYGKDRPIVVQGTAEERHRMNRVAVTVIE